MAEGSSATRDLVWFMVIIAGLWLVWVFGGGPAHYARVDGGPFIGDPLALDSEKPSEIRPGADDSVSDSGGSTDEDQNNWLPYRDQIELDEGNARYEDNYGREYIIIENRGRDDDQAINITGWQLANGSLRRSRVDLVSIPLATRLFSSSWAAVTMGPVILPPGGRAVIFTASPPRSNRWPARVSFQTNKCVGYLNEKLETLDLRPSLPHQCPRPSEEMGADRLPDDCYNFVRSLSACHQPEFKREPDGERTVDGRTDDLDRSCRLYIEDHFSYDRCLAWHQLDSDFYGDEWRVYLNWPRELWAENRETISLYDTAGKLVDRINY